ncbi:MAG: type I-D CRISPR-associated protein Cas10d/Csc3 [Microcoleaceae cyanobacterium]
MKTFLQRLLIETLQEKKSVLGKFIDTIIPNLETEFALIPALGGKTAAFSKLADQSLLVHVINGLITALNVSQYLEDKLSDTEQKLLCLGFTLHDYDKYFYYKNEEIPNAHEVEKITESCYQLGKKLNFDYFWLQWKEYVLDICYLAQNTQAKKGSNLHSCNWENSSQTFKTNRLDRNRLCELLRFGDIAVHLSDPAEIELNTSKGKALHECLDYLDINQQLVYHRLRDCRGLLTNQIHNAVVKFVRDNAWNPILYFAQGAVYLAPYDSGKDKLENVQELVWHRIINGDPDNNIEGLENYFSLGEVGFVRQGKGVKFAPITHEIFTPKELIYKLPNVVIANVKNFQSLATPKRLQKLDLPNREQLEQAAVIWTDRLAEFLILVQREFFNTSDKRDQYISWTLTELHLQNSISYEQTQIQSGGVNYGWYYVAVQYIVNHPKLDVSPNSEFFSDFLVRFAQKLADWAEENHLLPEHKNSTKEALFNYISQYLEVSGWNHTSASFESELTAYTEAKTKNNPICSLSSGEFVAEDQLASVVLFKPQQYSNKNSLGAGRIKRGISKIWSLEMILRQAYWSATPGKLEERQPIFLYIFPAYVYSPQVACAVGVLTRKLERMTLSKVCKYLKQGGYLDLKGKELDLKFLQDLPWLTKPPKSGRYGNEHSNTDLPFMAICPTTTMGTTVTDAWVEPVFKALALPILLGVKVVASPSYEPLYKSDREFLETIILDGVAGFWNILDLPTSLRIQDIYPAIQRLLVAYCLHLDSRSKGQDERWQAFNGTVREVMTDVLNVFTLANEGLRRDGRDSPTSKEVKTYWKYTDILLEGDKEMSEKLQVTRDLVTQYRQFYKVNLRDSSHAILLPITKALEVILSTPENCDNEELTLRGSGVIKDALDRQKPYTRPILLNTAIAYETRQQQELQAIQTFMKTCVNELFQKMCKGDIALLQEHRNRIKAGAEFAYRMMTLEEKAKSEELDSSECSQTPNNGEVKD